MVRVYRLQLEGPNAIIDLANVRKHDRLQPILSRLCCRPLLMRERGSHGGHEAGGWRQACGKEAQSRIQWPTATYQFHRSILLGALKRSEVLRKRRTVFVGVAGQAQVEMKSRLEGPCAPPLLQPRELFPFPSTPSSSIHGFQPFRRRRNGCMS